MAKILIVYSPVSQKHLVDAIISNCSDKTFSITGLNSSDWTFNGSPDKLPIFYSLVFGIFRKGKVRNILWKCLFTNVLKQISLKYDAIDITFFTPIYYQFLKYLKQKGKPYKITFWGSDFYRTTQDTLQSMRPFLLDAKSIQVETIYNKRDIIKVFPEIESKISVCNYGIDIFKIIDIVRENNSVLDETKDKLVLTCGYNGSIGQQHSKIIEAIMALPDSVKDKLFLLFPMTYGVKDENYVTDIEKSLEASGLKYKIYRERLTELELSNIRIHSDIAINIQVTDALSSSLIEHLYAGSILVTGDWLPYDIFSDYGISYHKTSIDGLSKVLLGIINNISFEKQIAFNNIKGAYQLSSWEVKAPILSNIFASLLR